MLIHTAIYRRNGLGNGVNVNITGRDTGRQTLAPPEATPPRLTDACLDYNNCYVAIKFIFV